MDCILDQLPRRLQVFGLDVLITYSAERYNDTSWKTTKVDYYCINLWIATRFDDKGMPSFIRFNSDSVDFNREIYYYADPTFLDRLSEHVKRYVTEFLSSMDFIKDRLEAKQ